MRPIVPGRRADSRMGSDAVAAEGRHVTGELSNWSGTYRFTAREVPRVESEPGMPGWSDVSAYLHISTFRAWDEVGRFWWGLAKDQLRVDVQHAIANQNLTTPGGTVRPYPALSATTILRDLAIGAISCRTQNVVLS